jgi:hypothetical protein
MNHSKQTPVTINSDLCTALQTGGVIYKSNIQAKPEDWQLAAKQLNFSSHTIPCGGAGSKAALLTKLADHLDFPDHFGMNLDALYDCLIDLLLQHKQAGTVLILEQTDELNSVALNPIVETLLDAAEFVQTKGHRLAIVIC